MKKTVCGVCIVFLSVLALLFTACPADGSPGPAPVIPGPGPDEPLDLSIGWIYFPTDYLMNAGEQFTVYSRIRIPGKTDITSGNDDVPGLEVFIGFGPAGSLPSAAGWSWSSAAPNPDYTDFDGIGANEYQATLRVDDPGSYHFALRYRQSASASWIYCDTAGRDYDLALAALLTVTDPCAGIICDTPPSSYCDGPDVIRYISPGMCDAGMCVYTTERVSCDSGMVCNTGMCVEE